MELFSLLVERLKQEMEDRLLTQLQRKASVLRLEIFERTDFPRRPAPSTRGGHAWLFSHPYRRDPHDNYRDADGRLRRLGRRALESTAPGRHRPWYRCHRRWRERSKRRIPFSSSASRPSARRLRSYLEHILTGARRRQGSANLQPRIGLARLVGASLLAGGQSALSAKTLAVSGQSLAIGFQSGRSGRWHWLGPLGP